jgi:hypothetical protein
MNEIDRALNSTMSLLSLVHFYDPHLYQYISQLL